MLTILPGSRFALQWRGLPGRPCSNQGPIMLESLEKMLSQGMDNPMLRFGLGKGYLDAGQPGRAAQHLRRCVELDPRYSAAWKLLGKALQADGDKQGAHEAWESGIAAANARGDKQAEKEMSVFLRRLARP